MARTQTPPSPRASSAEQSLPTKTPMRSPHASPSRKRPRVDDGSESMGRVSTDTSNESTPDKRAVATPVHVTTKMPQPDEEQPLSPQRVTLNLRAQPTAEPIESAAKSETTSSICSEQARGQEASPRSQDDNIDAAQLERVQEVEMQTRPQSPVVEIRVDEDSETPLVIELDEDDDSVVEAYLQDFPFLEGSQDLLFVANSIAERMLNESTFEMSYILALSKWLNAMPTQQWKQIVSEYRRIFDAIGVVTLRLLQLDLKAFINAQSNGRQILPALLTAVETYLSSTARLFVQQLHVDTEYLSHFPADFNAPQKIGLLCAKHLRAFSQLLTEPTLPWSSVFDRQSPSPQTQSLCINKIIAVMLKAPLNGLRTVAEFARVGLGRHAASQSKWSFSILNTILDMIILGPVAIKPGACRSALDAALALFSELDCNLQEVGRIVPVELNKELVVSGGGTLLRWFSHLRSNPAYADKIKGIIDPMTAVDSDSPELTYLPEVAQYTWKIRILHRYLVKGKMELRVASAVGLGEELVRIWHKYNDQDHPVQQYLARYLLETRIVDYLVGVDSHPQIIGRSSNIVSYLLVTRKYTSSETDIIWQTVSNSFDPRVVSATAILLKGMLGSMQFHDALYLLSKIRDLDAERYTPDMVMLFTTVGEALAKNFRAQSLEDLALEQHPFFVAFCALKKSAPMPEPTSVKNMLCHEATNQLRMFGAHTTKSLRSNIYQSAVACISTPGEETDATLYALSIITNSVLGSDARMSFEDGTLLRNDIELGRLLIPEFCSIVDKVKMQQSPAHQVNRIGLRMDLLLWATRGACPDMSKDIYTALWEHLVAQDAIDNNFRDFAWVKMLEVITTDPTNRFLDNLVTERITSLQPAFFTPALLRYINYLTRMADHEKSISVERCESNLISEVALLWRVALTAPWSTIEDHATQTLVERYLSLATLKTLDVRDVIDMHGTLADRCVSQLMLCGEALNKGRDSPVEQGKSEVEPIISNLEDHNLAAVRLLRFMSAFVSSIREREEFHESRPSVDVVLTEETVSNVGPQMEIKYQLFEPAPGPRNSLTIGEENTLEDLIQRLVTLTGHRNFTIIVNGARFSAEGNEARMLKDINGISWLLIRVAPNSVASVSTDSSFVHFSRFEDKVMEHFEQIFGCMRRNTSFALPVFEFLTLFPADQNLVTAVLEGSANVAALLPKNQPFAFRYGCRALRFRLKTLAQQDVADETSRLKILGILQRTIIDNDLINLDSEPAALDMNMIHDLMSTFRECLKNRPMDIAALDWSEDETPLVARLIEFTRTALRFHQHGHTLTVLCFDMLLESAVQSRKNWTALTSRDDVKDLHQHLLLEHSDLELHHAAARHIEAICANPPLALPVLHEEIVHHCWLVLSSLLPIGINRSAISEPFFGIYDYVFRKHDELTRDDATLRTLFETWSTALLNYDYREYVGRNEPEAVVTGLGKLLLSCVQSIKSFKKPLDAGDLAEKLVEKFLFPRSSIPRADPAIVPILEEGTRATIFTLVKTLCQDQASCDKIFAFLDDIYAADETTLDPRRSLYDRLEGIRSPAGRLGINNPSNICYMNSLLTQLYMNCGFREFMLDAVIADRQGAQRLLEETQALFARMQDSFDKAVDPRAFADCIRGLDGNRIDIRVQMDVDEFYNLLFDQWEQQMLSPEAKKKFRDFYGGESITQIKSKECEHVSERSESFFVIQCDVKGKANLHESLQSFVEGDVMQGDNKYKCESCGGKLVDAVKRTCLKDVPDNLILHLKRFDFDLTNMTRCKIDDYFEFPEQIDMNQYKLEHLSGESTESTPDVFELVGVLLHSGTAEAGHYFSYIRERPWQASEQSRWYTFNDRDVSTLDPKAIANWAFGGADREYNHAHPSSPRQKQLNAYMLFYQRRSETEAMPSHTVTTAISPFPRVPVPERLLTDIYNDNERILRTYCLFEPTYLKFLRDLLQRRQYWISNHACSESHDVERLVIRVALRHFNQILSRVKDATEIESLEKLLQTIYTTCAACSYTLIEVLSENPNMIAWLLLKCPFQRVRVRARNMISEALTILRKNDVQRYGVKNDEDSVIVYPNGALPSILLTMQRILHNDLEHQFRGVDDFFQVLCDLCDHRELARLPEAVVLIQAGFLQTVLEILNVSGNNDLKGRYFTLAASYNAYSNTTHFNKLIEFLHHLLCRIDFGKGHVRHEARDYDDIGPDFDGLPLSVSEHRSLWEFDMEHHITVPIARMLDSWDGQSKITPGFIPGEIVKLLLQGCYDDTLQVGHIFQTIKSSVQLMDNKYEHYALAAIIFCQWTPFPKYSQQLLKVMLRRLGTSSGPDLRAMFEFFNQVYRPRLGQCADRHMIEWIYMFLLENIQHWLYVLVNTDDEYIREALPNCAAVFFSQPFQPPEGSVALKEAAYRTLPSCIRVMLNELHRLTGVPYGRAWAQPVIGVLEQTLQLFRSLCNLQNDEALNEIRHDRDTATCAAFNREFERNLALLPVDDDNDNITSANEFYDGSDYHSDSEFEADDLP